jgi:two-component system chemotaxis sensor kinase CheA
MNDPQQDFLRTLQAAFQGEAAEHLQAIAAGLLELEHCPEPARRKEIVAAVFREAHSLKGAARAVDRRDIESICQAMESIFAQWRCEEVQPATEMLDRLHHALRVMPSALAADGKTTAGGGPDELLELVRELGAPPSSPAAEPPHPSIEPPRPAAAPPLPAAAGPSDTLRISTAKLDELFFEAEELVALKLLADQRAADLREVLARIETGEKQRANGADGAETLLHEMTPPLRSLMAALDQDRHTTAGLVDRLLEDAKKLLMLPFSTLLALFPKLVRDLSHDQGKEVDLLVRGTEVEVDKRILEELKDPLIHLLRNGIDHGIEMPEARARANKRARGTITIAVSPVQGNKVEICVSDDGAGIDPEAVKASALRSGIVTAEQASQLSQADAIALIFRPELSTSAILTEISGRGLGLAIVKEKVDRLSGRIDIETRPGAGTSFRLTVPLTLATFKGILVEAGGQILAVPTASAEHVCRLRPEDLLTVENREGLRIAGRAVAMVRLDDVLELPRQENSPLPQVIILSDGMQQIAFRVDAVLGEQEILLKRLRPPLARVRNIAGATVLGSGKVVPVLNAADLLKSAVRLRPRGAPAAESAAAPAGKGTVRAPRSILVVEDSITARMLIKGILESAGYRVKTAVDGLDAWTALKTEDFDLLVTDVEMPRMNGFELTARLRADKRLGDMPVVLVTALASREDRQQGVEAGANAYLVKSSFDQTNLLQVVGRLL